jgi:hypothetical protein
MRILALSDIRKWDKQRSLVDRYRPDVVVLAGDLTSDGWAEFWNRGIALKEIPAYCEEKSALMEKCGVTEVATDTYASRKTGACAKFSALLRVLEERHKSTPAFRDAREALKNTHVKEFYEFLRYAARKTEAVLVVKGDHDEDFCGDYDCDRINGIPQCHEISGMIFSVRHLVFLGLGFQHAGYRKPLRRFVADFKDKVDIVVAHAPQKNVRLITELRPRLLIRGHFGTGRYLIDGIPTVFTEGENPRIEIGKCGFPRIQGAGLDLLSRYYPWLERFPAVKNKDDRA